MHPLAGDGGHLKKKTISFTLAAGLQLALTLAYPMCICAAGIPSQTGPGWVNAAEGAGNEAAVSRAGWQLSDGIWYFYLTAASGEADTGLVGWHWIDGYCYYFQNDGKMLSKTVTPDGFAVSESGAWVADGDAVYRAGTGILTKPVSVQAAKRVRTKRSGGGRGGGSAAGRPDSGADDPWKEPSTADADKDFGEIEKPAKDEDENVAVCTYTIQYKDIASGYILKEIAGSGEKDSEIEIEHPDFDGYEICERQADTIWLASAHVREIIYYRPTDLATPSEAVEVSWEVRLVDAASSQREILPVRKGRLLEGEVLLINYMERVIIDQVIWEALEVPPLEVVVYGPGTQLFYIHYERMGTAPEPEDPYAKAREQLAGYLALAREFEREITGEEPGHISDDRLVVENNRDNDNRISSIVNQLKAGGETVFYLIGKNYKPNGIAIAEWLLQNAEGEYSSSTEAVITIGGDVYTVTRMSVNCQEQSENCSHLWSIIQEYPALCTRHGSRLYTCSRCLNEKTVILPLPGHMDEDHDLLCDRCGESSGDVSAGYRWKLGDIQMRELDGQTYFFECIDQNYADEAGNYNQAALFLCNDIIPADYGSEYRYEQLADGMYDYVFYPGELVGFGSGNDYKYSEVRSFLNRLSGDVSGIESTNIGINYAYRGATEEGAYEQLSDADLTSDYIGHQKMADKFFVLSVDEALKYKAYLWNTIESGPRAKGYWLRNPMGDGNHHTTDYVYIVDVVNGNIRPQHIQPYLETEESKTDDELRLTGTTGVRPAYTMTQH